MHRDIALYKNPKSSEDNVNARVRRIRKLIIPSIRTPIKDIIEPLKNTAI
jgi:hypothetical protein